MSHPLQHKLNAVRGRIRRVTVAWGVSWIVGAMIAATLLLGMTDYLVRFQDRGLRIISSLVALGVFLWTAYRYLLPAVSMRLADVPLARRIGRSFPEIGDSLACSVDFLEQPEDDPTAGSIALRRAVIAQVTADTERTDFTRVVDPRPMLRAGMVATIFVLFSSVLIALDPAACGIALARLANPFNDIAWPQATRLAIVDADGSPLRLIVGETFQVEVVDTQGGTLPERLRIAYRYRQPDGTLVENTRVLQPVESHAVARRINVSQPFSYSIVSEQGRSEWIAVEVIARSPDEEDNGVVVAVARPVVLSSEDTASADSSEARLAVVEYGPRVERIARGRTFEVDLIDIRADSLPPSARIHYRFEDPQAGMTEETRPLQFVNGRVHDQRDAVSRSFSYRVTAGDDRSMPWIPVEVVDPPSIESISVRLSPPSYTGEAPHESDARIRAIEGTQVELRALAGRSLQLATLCLEGGLRHEAQVGGPNGRNVEAQFTVERSGDYWFELVDAKGLQGGVDTRWTIHAIPDAAPVVLLQKPTSNVYVTPEAVVPLALSVEDDLRIDHVDLEFTRSDRANDPPGALRLWSRPSEDSSDPSDDDARGDSISVEHSWRLAELDLRPGVQVTFLATATDFRPSVGRSKPLRLIVITAEELTARIDARQTSILDELARVLQMQIQARRQTAEIAIRLAEMGSINQDDVDRLRGTELNQRQINRSLTSPAEGVPMHIVGLLADLDNNDVDAPDVRRRMQELLDEIDRLDREILPVINRELTSAIKAAQVELDTAATGPSSDTSGIGQPIHAAGAGQDEVIAAVEAMLGRLSRWDNYRRFQRDLGRLLHEQQELATRTAELGDRTLTRPLDDLTSEETIALRTIARAQDELARRLDNLLQDMEQTVAQLQSADPAAAETVSDGAFRARELAIAGRMRDTADHVQRNRSWQATDGQKQIVHDLREVLDVLANRRERELARLVKKLRQAEADLADLAERQEGLRKEIDQAAGISDEEQQRRELQRLARQQRELAEEADRMARRLERLTAKPADETTREATDAMNAAGDQAAAGKSPQASQAAAEAKKKLDEAAEQLAQRRRQAEVELAMEEMARLQETISGLRKRQEKAIQETERLEALRIDQGRLTEAQTVSLGDLARLQTALRTDTIDVAEKLSAAVVFTVALSATVGDMGTAARLIVAGQTNSQVQDSQRSAMMRLDQLLLALQQDPPEEPGEEQDDPAGGGGEGGNQGPSPAELMQALAELKLLKLMQEETNRRTRAMEEKYGPLEQLPLEAINEYARLGAEQRLLADLLSGLLPVVQDPEVNPEELPDFRPELFDE